MTQTPQPQGDLGTGPQPEPYSGIHPGGLARPRLGAVGLGERRLQRGHHDLRLHRLPHRSRFRRGGRHPVLDLLRAVDRRIHHRPAGAGHRSAGRSGGADRLLARCSHRRCRGDQRSDVPRSAQARLSLVRHCTAGAGQYLLRAGERQLQRHPAADRHQGSDRRRFGARLGHGLRRGHRPAAHSVHGLHPPRCRLVRSH